MYIPDALKPDVIKFFDSPAGKALFIALEQRRLAAPGMTPDGLSGLISMADSSAAMHA